MPVSGDLPFLSVVSVEQACVFMLIVARIGGLFQLSPMFNSKEVFSIGKITLIIWISFVLVFVVPLPKLFPVNPVLFILALVSEFLVGVLMGFTVQLMVIGIEFAGSLMDTQAGMSAASALDPASGRTVTILSKFLNQIALLIFLVIDGHHMVLSALYQSFQLLPIGSPGKFPLATEMLLSLGTQLFAIAVQFSAPILFVVFLIDFCFGLLSRVAPQLNVFQLGFQVKPIISIFILFAMIPGLVDGIRRLLETITDLMLRLFMVLH